MWVSTRPPRYPTFREIKQMTPNDIEYNTADSIELINRRISDRETEIKIMTHINQIVNDYTNQVEELLDEDSEFESDFEPHFELIINNVITNYNTDTADDIDDLVEKVAFILDSIRETYEYRNQPIYLNYYETYNECEELYTIQEKPVNP